MIDAAGALGRFERSTRLFLDVLDAASEESWLQRPPGEEWSLAEAVEHVVLTDRSVGARLRQLPAAPIPVEAQRFEDAAIHGRMFETAGQPPPGLAEPKGRFATRAEGIRGLAEARDELVTWVRATTIDLRAHGLPHPVFGLFDGVQWILFLAAHTDNHLPQARRLLARSGTTLEDAGK